MNNTSAEITAVTGCAVDTERTLSQMTSFKMGGKCGGVVEPDSVESCCAVIKYLEDSGTAYRIMGRGSNIIADDKGIRDIVVHIGDGMSEMTVNGEEITCQAGVPLSAVCRAALDNELTGAEFAYGIPGSVGGAVYMNAGAYGGEIKDIILYAEAVHRKTGERRRFYPDELGMSYRHSFFMNNEYVILSAAFRLKKGDPAGIKARMEELIGRRKDKQPLEYPSAGSFFKRPQGSYASLLIEQCGLKGFTAGGAQVSEKHSGFVINKGGAVFDDVVSLLNTVRDTVSEKTGYILEPEPVFFTDRYDLMVKEK